VTGWAAPRRALFRVAIGFLLGLAFWYALSPPYERLLAFAAEPVLRVFERPAVTRLSAANGEILVDRSDFPPAAPRPGLPAADLHFNFVILAALFGFSPSRRIRQAAVAAGILFAVHVIALCCQVESLYATRLGAWSAANYGTFARNFWSTSFHIYQIAGRFAAPFAIWWPLAGWVSAARPATVKGPARRKKRRKT
jgi:hypothetical protein